MIIKHTLLPEEAQYLTTGFPQYQKYPANPTTVPIGGLGFDAAADEAAYWKFIAQNYGTGNLTCNIYWYADAATSGDVIFDASLLAVTPDTDNTNIETETFATVNSVTDTHLGTTGQRLHKAVITISNLDSLAADDLVFLRLARDADNGSDTMSGDVIVVVVELTYSDT